MESTDRKTLIIALSILIAGSLIAVAVVLSSNFEQGEISSETGPTVSQEEALAIGNAPVLGDINAPITMVEFGDFQCPYCVLFAHQTVPLIRSTYIENNVAKMVFKSLAFLDDTIGEPESYNAALAAECSKEQGKFWAMHDAIYAAEYQEMEAGVQSENSGNLSREFFITTAGSLGMDVESFTECFDSEAYADQLQQYALDAEGAMPTGVSTPTVFVNGTKVGGAQPFSTYQSLVDQLLSQ